MAFADFLFSGSAPSNVNTSGSSTQVLPSYVQDYAQGVINSGVGAAGLPYQPYGGPRVAPLTDNQNRGIQNARQEFDAAPWLGYLTQAGQTVNNAQNINPSQAAQPYLQQAAGVNAVGAAQPFIDQAGQTLPGQISNYMSPYTSGVVDEIGRLGKQNYNENILPGVNDIFTRSGQYGSTRHQEIADRSARDTALGITGQQAGALEQGYGMAGSLFNQDQSRLAGLASTAAGVNENQARRMADIGTSTGNLATATAGQQLSSAGILAGLAQQRQQQGQSAINSLLNAGSLEQGNTQLNYDTAYQDFQNQRAYPEQQASWLSGLLRGTPTGSQTDTSAYGPASSYSPSVASQLAGLGTGAYALSRLKRGGPVVRMRRGGPVMFRRGGALTMVGAR